MGLGTLCRQQGALIRRYGIITYRYPFRSLLRIVIWPGAIITLLLYTLFKFTDESGKAITQGALGFIPRVVVILTIFHHYSLGTQVISDNASGFKSLMTTSGLKRINYHLAMSTCSLLYLIPISTIMAAITKMYLLDDTVSWVRVTTVWLLFAVHADSLLVFFASIITSVSYSFIIPLVIFFENLVHTLAEMTTKNLGEGTKPYVLFVASLSPYEALRLFYNKYVVSSPDAPLLTQEQHLIIISQVVWLIALRLIPYFFESALGRGGDDKQVDIKEHKDHPYFEKRIGSSYDVGIQLSHVSKKFRNVPAISDITLSIFKGETTLLLGHNGAGKSTLMNMILGLLKPDKGKVQIKARSRSGHVSSIGVCPQTSILDDDLSVLQHLELFNDLKSDITGRERQMHIKQTLVDVSLTEHANKQPQELSGGMKRKLSLAIAFVGKSGVLILDEPSSGLDPDSRVYIWNAIQRYRAERTVLLSTQHMEEADYLGDRIAILSAGRLVCCGSSVFLNNLFGSGYKLRIECKASNQKFIFSRIQRHFNGAQLAKDEVQTSKKADPNTVIDFVVELRSAKGINSEGPMIELLTDLENHKDQLGVISFGLKSSSIEDVMLNTGEIFKTKQKLDNPESAHLTIQAIGDHLDTLARSQKPSFANRSSSSACYRILAALCKKQCCIYRSFWITVLLLKVVLPILSTFSAIVDKANSTVRMNSYWLHPAHGLMVAHFVFFPVRECASKFKIMQLGTDMKIWHYWTSWYLFDHLATLVPLISINVFLATHLKAAILVPKWELHGIVTGATYLFCLASMSFCYLLSNIMSSPSLAYGVILIIGAMSSITYLSVSLLRLALFDSGKQWIQNVVGYIGVAFLPTDAYAQVYVGLSSQCYIHADNQTTCEPTKDVSNLHIGLAVLLIQMVAYALLLFAIESQVVDLEWYLRCRNICCCLFSSSPSFEEREIDKDVQVETAKAKDAIQRSHDPSQSLVAAGLHKSYVRSQPVVRDLSFMVQRGECFGLLGVNGAGKTTTFSMLAGESPPDSGHIRADGIDRNQDLEAYRGLFGYDPQIEPRLALTPHQALHLMGRLRGVPKSKLPMVIHSTLELLSMSQHEHKADSELSGGTKRKLALGMALVGNPVILALDEPTAGVDPLARRNVWQLLKSLRSQNKASIVISSHAMEECEAICDRISIMARGRLRCIGSFLHLRSKFAKGCRLRITFPPTTKSSSSSDRASARTGRRGSDALTSQAVHELQELLAASIGPSAFKLADRNVNSITFEILNNQVRRSLLFRMLRDYRLRHPNISYVLNDSSLEQIFISLAQEQQALERSIHPPS